MDTAALMAGNLAVAMSRRVAVLVLVIALLLIVGLSYHRLPPDKVVFLNIGQGDSMLLQDGTSQILIDGGKGKTVLTRLSEELPWFDRKIEVLIATHPDQDHLEGLVHVLEQYDVELVLLPDVAHRTQLQDAWLTRLREQVQQRDVAYRFASAGQRVEFSDLKVQILGPAADAEAESTNNASVITRVDLHDLSLLLTADAEASIERELIAATPPDLLDVDILKAGHHGSRTSTSDELLRATSPAAVAISVGAANTYGHPHPHVLERLKPYLVVRTDQHGSLRYEHRGGQWLFSCGTRSLFTKSEKNCMKQVVNL